MKCKNMKKEKSADAHLLGREECVFVIVDVQEKLVPAVAGREEMISNLVRMTRF